PYAYREQMDGDAVVIHARFRLQGEQADALRGLIVGEERYLPVVRKGITDEPMMMRFGRTIWSEKDGNVSQEVVLVEKSYDDKPRPALFEPEMTNVRNNVAILLNEIDGLADLLL